MRYIGLDFGEKTIGAAVSDPDNKIALGLETLWRESPAALRANIRRLGELIREYGVTEIVLGYPINMSGGVSARSAETLRFKEKLERNFKRVPVTLWDERLSTAAVLRSYVRKDIRGADGHVGKSGGYYGRHVDEMAAVYILQGFLDYKNKNTEVPMNEEQDIITMYDDDGEEAQFHVLSSKKKDGVNYMMTEEIIPEDADEEEEFADVLFFKEVPGGENDEEAVFEIVTDEDEDFEAVLELFKDEFEEFGIEADTIEFDE